MKINITKNEKYWEQFLIEIKNNKKDYWFLFLENFYYCLLNYFLLCVIVNSIILLCTFAFGHTSFLIFLIIDIILALFHFLIIIDLSFLAANEKIEELQIKDNKYITIKETLIGNVQINKIKRLYETESFIFILFQLNAAIKTILISKDELGNFTHKFIEIVNLHIEENKIEERKNRFKFTVDCYLKLGIFFVSTILVSLYLFLMVFLFNFYPMSKIKDSQISVSNQRVIYLESNSPYLKYGVEPNDILLEINGIEVKSMEREEILKMLNEENVKFKVLKKDNKEYEISIR